MPRKSTLYLPPEVVEIIAGYLAFEHPPTLLRFAKASRMYYASSQPAIKSIKFVCMGNLRVIVEISDFLVVCFVL